MKPFITLKKINKFFNQQHILKNITLNITQGELIAITGASGSGKSTLLSIIGLLESFDSGSYQLLNHDVTKFDELQLSLIRNKNLGWIFQNFNLIDEMTVLDNVILPLRYYKKLSTSQQRKTAQQALKSVGLEGYENSKPAQLSGGQQQRVAIARAIVNKPEIILADEPTGNLDSENQESIFNLLIELNQQGSTIILVTHANELAKYCDRIINIKDGNIVSDIINKYVVNDHNNEVNN